LKEEAIVLADDSSPAANNLVKVLQFFGISCRIASSSDLLGTQSAPIENGCRFRVLCSSNAFARVAANLERSSAEVRRWKEQIHSVFVYAGDDRPTLQLVGMLTRADATQLKELSRNGVHYVVSDQINEVCGPMAGVRIAAAPNDRVEFGFCLRDATRNRTDIISVDNTTTLLKAEYHDVPVILSSCRTIIDIDAVVESGVFNIRQDVSLALPIVLYVKWAFPETCWRAPEINACLVIDDPVLKQSYGCLNFEKLLNLMQRYNFSTNVAFIPWNWRRGSREAVRLFNENPNKYSISVHGCDHTRSEFGSSNRAFIRAKIGTAIERMSQHEHRTGIRHDRVMVFPQGVFSDESIRTLKRSEFVAAVNNDTISSDLPARRIQVRDLWDIAVMTYDNFPVFTRRYPWEGIENFAFDTLLGKPAIAVIHHDYCNDGCAHLIDFIQRLNALKCPITWRSSLEEVARRTIRGRKPTLGLSELEMYGKELRIENKSDKPRRYAINRRELNAADVKQVLAGETIIAWHSDAERLHFEVELQPGDTTLIKIAFHEFARNGQYSDTFSARAKIMARRYLSEVRDNYITPLRLRFAR
jgi:hypothetical protein